jgi:hypothetical protein
VRTTNRRENLTLFEISVAQTDKIFITLHRREAGSTLGETGE